MIDLFFNYYDNIIKRSCFSFAGDDCVQETIKTIAVVLSAKSGQVSFEWEPENEITNGLRELLLWKCFLPPLQRCPQDFLQQWLRLHEVVSGGNFSVLDRGKKGGKKLLICEKVIRIHEKSKN